MAYFANSSEDVLTDQCYDCPFGSGWNDPNQKMLFENQSELRSCPVALIQLTYNYDQIKKGNEYLRKAMTVLVDNSGVCRVRKLLVEVREEEKRQSWHEHH